MYKINIILITIFVVIFNKSLIAKDFLIMSSIPDESITELHKKFLPLTNYLEKKINMKIKFYPVTDYAAVVEGLANNKIDLAWLGGFTYIQAKIRSNNNVLPIIQREKDTRFTSVFISHKDNKVNSLEDLRKKSFSFGSPSSTSGHLMPRSFLRTKNISPEIFFSRISYSGAHDATIYSVLGKKVFAGVLNSLVWQKFLKEKPKIAKDLDVVFTSPEYYDYNWTIRKDVPEKIRRKLIQAFLNLNKNNNKHQKILNLQRANFYLKTKDENYQEIFEAARESKLIK